MGLTIQGPSVEDQIKERLKGSEGAHWYRKDGTPAHRQEDGSNTTLRHARKALREEGTGLYPSVTSILKIAANDTLEKWKQRMLLTAAYQYRNTDHDCDEWIEAVTTAAWSKSKTALDFGSEYHHYAWLHNSDQEVVPAPEMVPFYDGYQRWFNQSVVEVLEAETVLVSPKGYAGTADIIFRHSDYPRDIFLGDFKTQDVKPKYGPRAWPEHATQLAAYRKCITKKYRGKRVRCMNIVIDKNDAQRPLHEHVWKQKEIDQGWLEFSAALKLWQARKKYKP